MSLLSELYNKVVAVTNRLNQIEENAKTNDEFPTQSELVLSSKIRVSNGGVTEVISVEDIVLKAVATSQPYLNRFIETTGISSTGLGISINPNWIWMINGIRYSNPVENSFVNYYAATGFQRIDIIVATENVDFQLIHGIEAEIGVETPVAPVLPINALLVTTILVGDDSMDSPTLPESGYDFLISTDSDNAIVLGSDGKLWSGGGGGSVGTLQQVTDNGNTTTNAIEVSNHIKASEFRSSADDITFADGSGNPIFFFASTGANQANFSKQYLTSDRDYEYPDASGTIALTSDIPTVDAAPTDGSSNAVSSNGVFDALALKQDLAVARTGAVIAFDALAVYNSFSSPTSSNITDSLGTAKIGIVQKIYSNKATEPTYPAGWVNLSGTYTNSVTNIIYCEWCEGSRVEYWIVKA